MYSTLSIKSRMYWKTYILNFIDIKVALFVLCASISGVKAPLGEK
jgi:hypothetical protein